MLGGVQRGLGPPPRRDVADIALDHPLPVHQVDVADELHLAPFAGGGLQRQVLVADILVLLQFQKLGLVGDGVPEEAQLPDGLAHKLVIGIAEQADQKRIYVHHQPGLGVQDQNAVLGRQMEAVEVVHHHHVEGGRGRAFLLVAAHMEIVVIGAAIGEPVDQPGIAVVGEDDRLVRGEERVEIRVAQPVRDARCGGCSFIRSTTLITRTLQSGRCFAQQSTAASVSRVGTSPRRP
jgi:hypothetical protein